jgi:ribosomal protein S27AE
MELTLNNFVLVVLFATMILVTIFVVFTGFLQWNSERKLKRLVMVCRLCGHVFLNRDDTESVHCGACQAVNRRNGNGKLG